MTGKKHTPKAQTTASGVVWAHFLGVGSGGGSGACTDLITISNYKKKTWGLETRLEPSLVVELVLGVFGDVGDVALAAAGPSLVAVVGWCWWWYGSRLWASWQTKLHPRLAFASKGGGISAGWRVMGAGCRNNKENENKY